MFYFLFFKVVKIMVCMVIIVIYYVFLNVKIIGVIYSLDIVLYVNLDGLGWFVL